MKRYTTRDFIDDTEREAKKLSILSLIENDSRKAASIRAKLASKKKLLDNLKGFFRSASPRDDGLRNIEYR